MKYPQKSIKEKFKNCFEWASEGFIEGVKDFFIFALAVSAVFFIMMMF